MGESGGCLGRRGDLPSKPAVWRMYLLQRAFRVSFAERDLAVVSRTHLWRSDMARGVQKTVADEMEDERMRRGEERKEPGRRVRVRPRRAPTEPDPVPARRTSASSPFTIISSSPHSSFTAR